MTKNKELSELIANLPQEKWKKLVSIAELVLSIEQNANKRTREYIENLDVIPEENKKILAEVLDELCPKVK